MTTNTTARPELTALSMESAENELSVFGLDLYRPTGNPLSDLTDQHYPILSADAQREIVLAFQQKEVVKASLLKGEYNSGEAAKAQALITRAETAFFYLTGAVARTLHKRVRLAYLGRDDGDALGTEEAFGQAVLEMLEAAATYDPSKGSSFHTWMRMRIDKQIPAFVSASMIAGHLDTAASVVRNYAFAARRELREETGTEPSLEAIQTRIKDTYLRDNLTRLSPADQLLPADEQEAIVWRKFQKAGYTKTVREDLAAILSASSTVFLDAPVSNSDDDTTTAASLIITSSDNVQDLVERRIDNTGSDTFSLAFGNMSSAEREAVMACWGFVEDGDWTYKKAAEEFSVDSLRLKHLAAQSKNRLSAPHMQFAHLGQVSMFVSETDTVSAANTRAEAAEDLLLS